MPASIFSPEHYAAPRLPLNQASPLPAGATFRRSGTQREIDTLFRKDWLCVGPRRADPESRRLLLDRAARPSADRRARRERPGPRALGAVPPSRRHRHGRRGPLPGVRVPVPQLDLFARGELVSTPGSPPPMAGAEGFTPADHGLTPVRAETVGRLHLRHLQRERAAAACRGSATCQRFLEGYDLENMQWTHRDDYVVDCNWKVWLENAFENYHAMTIHRKHMDPSKPQNWRSRTRRAGRGRRCSASAASSPTRDCRRSRAGRA